MAVGLVNSAVMFLLLLTLLVLFEMGCELAVVVVELMDAAAVVIVVVDVADGLMECRSSMRMRCVRIELLFDDEDVGLIMYLSCLSMNSSSSRARAFKRK